MQLRVLCAVFAGFAFGAFCALAGLGHIGPWRSSHPAGVLDNAGDAAIRGSVLIGGPFALVNHLGAPTTHHDLQGNGDILVVFGYTRSENLTPSALNLVTAALNGLGLDGKQKKIQPVFITLDPEFDTPGVLAGFLKNYHPSLIGLTGSIADIDAIAKAYKVFFSRPDRSDSSAAITYSAFVFLMDADGHYISHLRVPTQLNKLDSLLRSRLH